MTKRNQRLGMTEVDGHKIIYVGRRGVLTENGWYRLRRGEWVRNNKPCWKRDYPKQVGKDFRRADKANSNNRKRERQLRHQNKRD